MEENSALSHTLYNSLISSAPLLASASDDGTVKLWDARTRGEVGSLDHGYAVTAVAYSPTQIYSGGLDNAIYAWDLRTCKKSMKMTSHTDTITYLALHPKETQLLSYSMDSLLKTWDIQPFCSGKRLLKTFEGGKHNAEKGLLKCAWSPDGSMVTGGSADRMVHIWDEVTTQEVRLTERCCIAMVSCFLTQYDAALSSPGTHWMCQYGRLSPQGERDCIRIFR